MASRKVREDSGVECMTLSPKASSRRLFHGVVSTKLRETSGVECMSNGEVKGGWEEGEGHTWRTRR